MTHCQAPPTISMADRARNTNVKWGGPDFSSRALGYFSFAGTVDRKLGANLLDAPKLNNVPNKRPEYSSRVVILQQPHDPPSLTYS